MPYSRDPATYSDVKRFLDLAKLHNGLRFTLSSNAEAVRWCARAHSYLRTMRQRNERDNEGVVGYIGSTPYDHLRIKRREASVEVVPRDEELIASMSELTDLQGNPLNPSAKASPAERDEYEVELAELLDRAGPDLDLELGDD